MAGRYIQPRYIPTQPAYQPVYMPPTPLDLFHEEKRKCARIMTKIQKINKNLQDLKNRRSILLNTDPKDNKFTPKQIKKHAKLIEKCDKKIKKYERKLSKRQTKLNIKTRKLETYRNKAKKYIDIK